MDSLDLFSHLYPNERSQIKGDSGPTEKRIQHSVYHPHNSISSFSETVATKVEPSFPAIPIAAEQSNIKEEENGIFSSFER